MNRAVRKFPLFQSKDEYAAFVGVLCEAVERVPVRLLCYVVMPNHWHLVVWPSENDYLPRFMKWLTGTHALRWNARRGTAGFGAVYQGRYKAIPVHDDRHFLTVCRYVERNPIKARLVERAALWPWSSASETADATRPELDAWPTGKPDRWSEVVDAAEGPGEFEHLRAAIRKSAPFGPGDWSRDVAEGLKWPNGLRGPGRPPWSKSNGGPPPLTGGGRN
jgi:putative transposase